MVQFRELMRGPNALARIVQGALEAEGLRATVDREARSPFGLDSGWFATRVLVAESDLERAREVLAEIEASDV
ncbi:MAG TPA: DUF2007 domain-containing protein [Egibacteraceae bacterium]|nr:DUF2007 domain-containing protein [Egibacteraceae bacterium]